MFKFFTTPQHGASLTLYVTVTTLCFIAVLALLHPTSSAFKKRLTMALAFLGGAFYLIEFLLPSRFRAFGFAGPVIDNPFSPYLEPSGNMQNIILALAIMLGIVNLFRVNGRLIIRRRSGWHNGVVFFVGFFGMLAFGMLDYFKPFSPAAQTQIRGWYDVFFSGAFTALGATSFSLLAFYIVSAAYRSFRVRSPEAILLLCSALIMMLGLTPLGTKFVTGWIPMDSPMAWIKLETVSEWILTVLNGAAQRALLFGIAVGVVATSLRIWLSLERGQFFDTEV
jgi:hypothetical protein